MTEAPPGDRTVRRSPRRRSFHQPGWQYPNMQVPMQHWEVRLQVEPSGAQSGPPAWHVPFWQTPPVQQSAFVVHPGPDGGTHSPPQE